MVIKRFFFIFFVSVALFSCGNRSNKEETKKNRFHIVSLVPSLTKELVALGLTKNIVGATSYCNIAKDNKKLIVGSAMNVNMEKVLLLKPDVVFAGGLTSKSYIKTLMNEGIKVYVFKNPSSYRQMCDDLILIGRITGREEKAKEIVKHALYRIDSIRKTVPALTSKLKFFFQIGADPLYSVIPGTFMNDYILFAGCENIAFDMKEGSISREAVLTRNPDVIFISTMGIIGDKEKEIWNSYPELNATINKKIFIIDSDIACSATVNSFVNAFEYIKNKIYGK